jgi:DNA-binding GntR family transcriptional regulator
MSRIHQEASLSDDVYYQLKNYILKDIVHPAERLQIGQLSQHFGVSITPIREALIRLAAEALVDLKPGRGFFYKEFVPAEQVALYDAMFCLMKYAIERDSGRMHLRFLHEPKAVSPERERAPRTEAETYADVVASENFAEQVAQLSGNAQIIQLVRSLCDRTRISRVLDMEQPANAFFIIDGLKQIVAVLQQGDRETAISLLRDQIEQKRLRMTALANERRRRLYEQNPLLEPSAGRNAVVRYRDEDGRNGSSTA